MSGLETAIRNALGKADRGNAEVRARIYQSARQALETGLRKQDVSDPAVVAAQRHRLETTIKSIEQEERARLGIPTVDPVVEVPYDDISADLDDIDGGERDAARAAEGDDDFGSLRAERLTADPRQVPVAAPAPELPDGASSRRGFRRVADRSEGTPSNTARKKRRRGAYARLFVTVMFLAFLGMGAWWVYTSDLLLTDAERDTSVANPPAAVSEEDISPPGTNGSPSLDSANNFSKDWVEVFKPGDVERVVAGGLSSVKLISTGEGPAIRIVSSNGSPDASVRVLLPRESLSLAEGQQATIALSLKSASDEPVQVLVDCDFGGQASCERHRFTVTSQRSDALLQVVPGAAGAGGQPALVLNSDVEGKGRGVDLLAVRLLPVP